MEPISNKLEHLLVVVVVHLKLALQISVQAAIPNGRHKAN